MKTEVILTHNIVGLGGESDHVKVAAGYARNYLYPHGLAIPVTAANKRRLEALRQRRAERESHELNTMTDLAKSLSKLVCVVMVKTGEDGKMFGAVTNGMIADQLKIQFDVTLDKRKIHLAHPIRALGEHEVELRLHQDVTTILKVRAESSTPLPAPVAPSAPEGRRNDYRTEKRGRRPEAPIQNAEAVDRKARSHRPEKATAGDKPARAEKAPKAEKAPEGRKSE